MKLQSIEDFRKGIFNAFSNRKFVKIGGDKWEIEAVNPDDIAPHIIVRKFGTRKTHVIFRTEIDDRWALIDGKLHHRQTYLVDGHYKYINAEIK